MEAMATGVPVVVYDDLNVKDIVVANLSGRLFSTESELTEALVDTFANEHKTKRLSKKATEIVNSLSKESYAKNAEHVYYQLINNTQALHQLNA